RSAQTGRMDEAFPSVGRFRCDIPGQPIYDRTGDLDGVLHPSLGKAWMDGDALDGNFDTVGRERLVFYVSGCLPIHRIGKLRSKLGQVDLVNAATDLLIGREKQLDRSVPDVGI